MAFLVQTLKNSGSAALTNYPLEFMVPVSAGEITQFARCLVNGVAVPATIKKWQARADGSWLVAHVMALVPSLAAGASATIELENSATDANGVGFTAAQLQDATRNFDVKISNDGTSITLKSLLSSSNYEVVSSGATATKIKVFDWLGIKDFAPANAPLVQCLTPWAYVTFYSTGQAHYEVFIEHSNSEKLLKGGAAYTLGVLIGDVSPVSILTKTFTNHFAGWQVVAKGWTGVEPSKLVDRKLNIATYANAGWLNKYDPDLVIDSAALQTSFASLPTVYDPQDLGNQFATFPTWFVPAALTVGGDNPLMEYPTEHARAIYGDYRAMATMDRTMLGMCSFPVAFRERDPARANFGTYISQTTRPGQVFLGTIGGCNLRIRYSGIPSTSRLTWKNTSNVTVFGNGVSTDTTDGSPSEFLGRSWDAAHLPVPFLQPAYQTGSMIAYEQSQAWASWTEHNELDGNNGPTASSGITWGRYDFGYARHTSRSLKTFHHAALIAQDASYWLTRLQNNLQANAEFWSGIRDLPYGSGTPNYAHAQTNKNRLYSSSWPAINGTTKPPLGNWYADSETPFWGVDPTGNGTITGTEAWASLPNSFSANRTKIAFSPFNEAYLAIALSNLKKSAAFTGKSAYAGWPDLAVDHSALFNNWAATTEGANAQENLRIKRQMFFNTVGSTNATTGAYVTTYAGLLANWNPTWVTGSSAALDQSFDSANEYNRGTGAATSVQYIGNGGGNVVRAAIIQNGNANAIALATELDAQRAAQPLNFGDSPKAALVGCESPTLITAGTSTFNGANSTANAFASQVAPTVSPATPVGTWSKRVGSPAWVTINATTGTASITAAAVAGLGQTATRVYSNGCLPDLEQVVTFDITSNVIITQKPAQTVQLTLTPAQAEVIATVSSLSAGVIINTQPTATSASGQANFSVIANSNVFSANIRIQGTHCGQAFDFTRTIGV